MREGLHAFKVMAYSRDALKKAMALTSLPYSLEKFHDIPLEKEITYLGYGVLDMSWYRIYVRQEQVGRCYHKLDQLKRYDIIGGWYKDEAWWV